MKNIRRALKKIEESFSYQNMVRTKWNEKNIRREAARIKDRQHWGSMNEMLTTVPVEVVNDNLRVSILH